MQNVKAISLDLDDTLWPIWPAIERAERQLHEFLLAHAPATAQRFPIPAMRRLRDDIARQHPELAHDYSAQRKLSLARALADSGAPGALVEPAFEAFYRGRNHVDLFEDALPALAALSARLPLVALTNGNADLAQIGLAHFFTASISARELGSGKPDAPIFAAACQRLGLPPQQILHVGDDPWLDVEGARAAGLRSAWINRTQQTWPAELARAEHELHNLLQLAALIEASETCPCPA